MQLATITSSVVKWLIGSGLGPHELKPHEHPRHSYGYRVASFDMAYSEECMNFLGSAGYLSRDYKYNHLAWTRVELNICGS